MEKYPKLNIQENCCYPERDNCNHDDDLNSRRCEFKKYNWRPNYILLYTPKFLIVEDSH